MSKENHLPIFEACPFVVLFIFLIIHIFILNTNKVLFDFITPIISKTFQVSGALLVIIVINENSKTLDSRNLLTRICNWFRKLGIIHTEIQSSAPMKVPTTKMEFDISIVENSSNIYLRLDHLQKQIDILDQQVTEIKSSFKREIAKSKSEFSNNLDNILENLKTSLLGSNKWEIFGCFLIIYGVIIS